MKHQIMKCARRCLPWQGRLIFVPAALLFCVLSAQAQTDVTLKAIGGGGGGKFVARCPQGQLLAGVDLRTGDDVDAIRPLCVTATGPAEVGPLVPGGIWFGGDGGADRRQLVCPGDKPIVYRMHVIAQGVENLVVNTIVLECGLASNAQYSTPSVGWEGPDANYERTHPGRTFLGLPPIGGKPDYVPTIQDFETCGNGLVGVGISGRSGVYLDAVGLICGEPTLPPVPKPVVKLVDRLKLTTPDQPRSICDLAREARARNSPAAPGLEEQCRAAGPAGEAAPVKLVARAKVPTTTDGTPAPPRPICDVAREARERKSPAAPGLEEMCLADLAARGLAIAQTDSIVARLRAAEADEQYQRGFDIATGIFGDPALGAQGKTALGPGSLRIRDSLSVAGKRGFDDSVKLHFSRNYKQ